MEKGKWLWQRIWKNICRFYPLYIGWSLLGSAAGVMSGKISFVPQGIIKALVMGNEGLLAQYCGMALFWFLPTIVAVMFWRDLYFLSKSVWKKIILGVSVILWICSAVGWTNFHSFGLLAPVACFQGLFFAASGIISRSALEKLKDGVKTKVFCCGVFIIAVSYVYWRKYLPASCVWLTWVIVPTVFFITIFQFRHYLSKVAIFRFLGKYSLQIYLLHSFIFNLLLRFCPYKNIGIGIGNYIVTLSLSVVIAMVCEKTVFKKILFT